MIDHVGQILAEASQQFVARQACLGSDRIDLVGAERVGEIAGRNRLVLALADPRIGHLALAALLQLVEEVAEPAGKNAAGRAARQQAAEPALQHVAETAARQSGVDSVRRRWRRASWRGGRSARLAAAKMLDRFP